MSPFDPGKLAGTPYLAPLVPPLPIRMRQTEILTIVYRTDEAAASRLVPQPLRLTGNLIVVHIYWMHDAEWFGVYGESAWQVPVELPDGAPAVYSPFLVLGSDGGVAAGRELYGQPKKMGEIVLESREDLLVGVVRRNGIDIATATTVYKQRRSDEDALETLVRGSGTNVNLRVVPEDAGGFRRELIARDFVDVVVHESWTGPATLELRPNAQAPVYLLPVREIVLGLHRVLDLTLPPGRVVHRY
ncbi:MAG TPA: acetoacetate decarboxylase [Solirubrobacteraceae bacterium]|nr:acetoacetate decarboxylase [Solirubrobacteraceae bacterium]